MITPQNIRGYINYLYLQRNGSNAPQELLNKWASLPANDIGVQLQNLYASWNMNLDTSSGFEKQYAEAVLAALPKPAAAFTPLASTNIQPHQTQQERPYVPAKKNNTNAWILGIALLAIIGCALAWIVNSTQKQETPAVAAIENVTPSQAITTTVEPSETTVNNAADSAAIAAAKIANPSSATITAEPVEEITTATTSENSNTPADENTTKIQQLLLAEEQRDFNTIYDFYSPSIERYWDIEYPTRDELQKRFTKVWQKSSNPKHSNVIIQKIADNKYMASGLYEYYHTASSSNKITSFKTYFIFDDNGKIIETNAAK
jgi:hypothetical protein